MSNRFMHFTRLSISTIVLSMVAACGGAGGGDDSNVPDDLAIAAIDPLIGVWDLPANWNGNGATGDETFLVIGSPDNDGIAEATIYEVSFATTGDKCFLTDNKGELSQSLNDDLFLDLPIYNSAIAALLPNGQLQISDFAVGATSTSEPELVFNATRATIDELPPC